MKKATFKGAVKFALRHIPSGKFYSSARYANGFVDTPTLKNDGLDFAAMVIEQWCVDSKMVGAQTNREYYSEQYGVPMRIQDFEIVEYTLMETATKWWHSVD